MPQLLRDPDHSLALRGNTRKGFEGNAFGFPLESLRLAAFAADRPGAVRNSQPVPVDPLTTAPSVHGKFGPRTQRTALSLR